MKAWAFFAVMLVALAAFCRCGSLNGGTNNRYVVSPLTDTLTIKLPGYETSCARLLFMATMRIFTAPTM